MSTPIRNLYAIIGLIILLIFFKDSNLDQWAKYTPKMLKTPRRKELQIRITNCRQIVPKTQ